MKHRISVSIDSEVIPQIRELIRKEHFLNNKSQVVEYAVKDLIRRKLLEGR